MIFSFFQVSEDRERCFTASVRHFTLCSALNSDSFTAAYVKDHSIAWDLVRVEMYLVLL